MPVESTTLGILPALRWLLAYSAIAPLVTPLDDMSEKITITIERQATRSDDPFEKIRRCIGNRCFKHRDGIFAVGASGVRNVEIPF